LRTRSDAGFVYHEKIMINGTRMTQIRYRENTDLRRFFICSFGEWQADDTDSLCENTDLHGFFICSFGKWHADDTDSLCENTDLHGFFICSFGEWHADETDSLCENTDLHGFFILTITAIRNLVFLRNEGSHSGFYKDWRYRFCPEAS
jgi:hypothetical protein